MVKRRLIERIRSQLHSVSFKRERNVSKDPPIFEHGITKKVVPGRRQSFQKRSNGNATMSRHTHTQIDQIILNVRTIFLVLNPRTRCTLLGSVESVGYVTRRKYMAPRRGTFLGNKWFLTEGRSGNTTVVVL